MRVRPVNVDDALEISRTGDIWLFRGRSGPDRAIQTLTNSPVNHVGMIVALDDLPPLMWHAELGASLEDMWTGRRQRGVQLHDARQAIDQWTGRYEQRCWFRQLLSSITVEQEDRLLETIARMNGVDFPHTMRLLGRWLRGRVQLPGRGAGRLPDEGDEEQAGGARRLESAYCAEVVAVTYEAMGLLETRKTTNWYDPGRFWSGDSLPLAPDVELGREIPVALPDPSRST
ncbi:guanylate cyclase [Millisia brevis]|uniref:guanylate cyclase n=1 Tax=Millisia brevis TaxID=264148 RepID=UPI0008331A87|nr:guanylate cyclase [Millisia brevis]